MMHTLYDTICYLAKFVIKVSVVIMKDFRVRTVHATDQLAEKVRTARLPTRAQQLTALRSKNFDVLVVGGGATGCGVALDAVSRGRFPSVALLRPL